MSTFAARDAIDTTPDIFGQTYQFMKINLDEFVTWVDAHGPDIIDGWGITVLYLEATQPDFNWYVTPKRIYYSSNEPYPENYYEILTEEIVEVRDNGWPWPPGSTTTTVYPVGTRMRKLDMPWHPSYFSETQKWVKTLEILLDKATGIRDTSPWVPEGGLKNRFTRDEYRAMIKTATGK